MKKILAIGASNSKKSINTSFATYVSNQLEGVETTVLDWQEMVLPLYSPEIETQDGVPANAKKFKQMIEDSDAIILSLAEHNGLPTAAFKNLWDWTSRLEKNIWANKPMFLSAVSPGGRGGASVLKSIGQIIPFFGGKVIVEFSFPLYHQNFKDGKIVDAELVEALTSKINEFQKAIE